MTAQRIFYDVDWVAIFTIVLTLITGYYAIVTHQILRAAARQAVAAEQSVALLLHERSERLQCLRAPVEHVVRTGRATTEAWIQNMSSSDGVPLDSAAFESANLKEIANTLLGQYFPLAQALLNVDQQIVRARASVDQFGSTTDIGTVPSTLAAEAELNELLKRWKHAEAVLATWQ